VAHLCNFPTTLEHLCPVDVMHIAHFCPAHEVRRADADCVLWELT
jgi:hypothetical protein